MKVVMVIDFLGAGGAQRQLVGLANMLTDRGIEVRICVYHDNNFYKNDIDKTIIVDCLPETNLFLKRIYYLYKYLDKCMADWVISFLESPCIYSCICRCFNFSFKLLVSERNTCQANGLRENIRFNLYRLANIVVPNSKSQELFINEHYPFLKDKVYAILNFVDIEVFNSNNRIPNRNKIMIASSISKSKNTKPFIKSVGKLHQLYPNLVFRIDWFGIANTEDLYYKECVFCIKKLKLEEFFIFHKKTNNISEVYNESGFFCLPSLYEGTPNALCEAISSGLPSLCSNVCDNSNYVIDAFNGFLFDPRSLDSMVSCLYKSLTLSDVNYELFSTRSRDLAKKKLSKQRFISEYISLLK